MRIERHNPKDVAVEWGLVAPELPPILSEEDMDKLCFVPPPQLVHGILHQGCKMLLAGTSKSNKSWCLIDMGLSVARGAPWWGRGTEQGDVLYLNFELQEWEMARRIAVIESARPELVKRRKGFNVWNLRGRAGDITKLKRELIDHMDRHELAMVIIDPAYKLLGDRDENSNGEIGNLMNEFETICQDTGAAVVIAHHFAKGDSSVKDPIDRMSGAGSWARDPDSILVLSPHEEPDCFTVTTILRNLPALPEFVVSWGYPVMRPVDDLDPAQLRSKAGRKRGITDRDFIHWFVGEEPKARQQIVKAAMAAGMSERTVDRTLARLARTNQLGAGGGIYWKRKVETEKEVAE